MTPAIPIPIPQFMRPDSSDQIGGTPILGPVPPGFLDPDGLVRQVPGTRAMPFGRQEVRAVFFGPHYVACYGLN